MIEMYATLAYIVTGVIVFLGICDKGKKYREMVTSQKSKKFKRSKDLIIGFTFVGLGIFLHKDILTISQAALLASFSMFLDRVFEARLR